MTDQKLLEEGDPLQDPRLFRRALGQFGTGVAVVTTHHAGEIAGVTVNSFASVSLEPPLVLWSISRKSRSFGVFEATEVFAINILSSQQVELSRQFSGSADDKFINTDMTRGAADVPLLEGVVAQIECTTESRSGGGDHVILIGRVHNVRRFGGQPLLFVDGRYAVPADHTDTTHVSETFTTIHAQTSPKASLIPLIFEAHNSMSAKFEDHRAAEGLSLEVARILATLEDHADIPIDLLSQKTYLGMETTQDAVAELAACGCVTVGALGSFTLTHQGIQRREAIRKRWIDFQRAELASISESEASYAATVLGKLIAGSDIGL